MAEVPRICRWCELPGGQHRVAMECTMALMAEIQRLREVIAKLEPDAVLMAIRRWETTP